ncbi:MAG: methyltransferase domain-containing protein [Thermomicrobiales bacterium]
MPSRTSQPPRAQTPPHCPGCSSETELAYHTHDYNQRNLREQFTWYRCRQCRQLFLDPVPADLGPYYSQAYYAIPPSLHELAQAAARKQYQIELVRQFVAGGRLLDIGPGHGAFAYLAKQAGFDVTTIELDAGCCQILRDVVGVTTIQSDDPASVLPTLRPQRVITLWHVIEHLRDPWECLARAAARLEPGGILLVAAPNPDALQFRLLGARWVHLDAPRHVNLLPAPLLASRLAQQGLQPLLVTTNDPGGLALNRYGWRASLLNCSERRWPRAAAWRLGAPLGLLASPLERLGLRGSAYTAIFRKPVEAPIPH